MDPTGEIKVAGRQALSKALDIKLLYLDFKERYPFYIWNISLGGLICIFFDEVPK